MTVQISKRAMLRAVVLVALVAAACSAAFLAGQSTRLTEATADGRVKASTARLAAQHAAEMEDALIDAKAAEQKRVRKVNEMWRGRMTRAKAAAKRARERLVEQARNEGYASGSVAGFSSGKEQGVEEGIEEGIEKASDDLVCSDDPDVDLPPCWDW